MVDYVERLDALKELALLDTGEEEYTDNISRTRATIAISNIPAADVAPVVRCGQCKHWQDNDSDYDYGYCYAKNGHGFGHAWGKNDFCSYGERKE